MNRISEKGTKKNARADSHRVKRECVMPGLRERERARALLGTIHTGPGVYGGARARTPHHHAYALLPKTNSAVVYWYSIQQAYLYSKVPVDIKYGVSACGPGTSNTGCMWCRNLKYGVHVVPALETRGVRDAGSSNTGCIMHVMPTAQIRGACGAGGPLIILRSICSVGYLHARGVRRERKRVERERESRERVERERRRERDPGRAACLLV